MVVVETVAKNVTRAVEMDEARVNVENSKCDGENEEDNNGDEHDLTTVRIVIHMGASFFENYMCCVSIVHV